MAVNQRTLDEAAMWAVRTSEPDFEVWPAFTDWLEADPGHAEAYDRAVIAADEGAQALGSLPANDPEWSDGLDEEESSPRRWIAPALAACLAIVAALWLWPAGDAATTYSTAPGETRTIALEDGSTILLAGDTEIVVEEERQARLNSGRALFEIRHDEADPFRLAVGDATLIDAGTVFEVTIREAAVAVGVAEGAVIYNPDGPAARIDPGEVLSFDRRAGTYRMESVPIEQVGEWRAGRLTFRDAPLAEVASDLSRATGIAYRTAEAGRARSISGSVAIDPLRRDPASLGPLLGIGVRRDGDVWILDGS